MEMSGFTEEQLTVREAIQKICAQFPNEYWQQHDQTETDPKELHAALAADGWLGIALPEEFGGAGLGIAEATMMLQTISQSGAGMAGAQSIHANVYATQALAFGGSKEQLQSTIPNIVNGKWRVCFGVTEPNTGLDTLRLRTTATRKGDKYIISGQWHEAFSLGIYSQVKECAINAFSSVPSNPVPISLSQATASADR
jgi:acyl-CoA dehydrogenase